MLLNYYQTHIPDDVSTYSFVFYINYDLLTQRVEAAMYCMIGAAPCM